MSIVHFASMLKTPSSGVAGSPSANTSANFVIIPLNGTGVRAGNKGTRLLDANTLSFASNRCYMPSYVGARWLVGMSNNNVLVFDESWTLKTTILSATHGAGIVFRIHYFGGKFCFIGSGGTRFGTYNETTDTWTNGTFLSNEVYPLDSVFDPSNGKAYISSTYSGTIARNVTVLDTVTETVTDRQTVAGSSTIAQICVGNTGLLAVATDGTARLVDKGTFATIASPSFPNIAGAIAYSQGKFWVTQQSNATLKSVDEVTGTVATPQSGLQSPTGCVADADFVYMAEQGGGKLTVVDALTGALNGSAITGLTSPVFTTS